MPCFDQKLHRQNTFENGEQTKLKGTELGAVSHKISPGSPLPRNQFLGVTSGFRRLSMKTKIAWS